VVGFHDEEVQIMYKMLAAILHLGDIEFRETASEDNTDNKATIIDTAPLHRGNNLLQDYYILSVVVII
jgi:myosin III